MKKLTYVSTMLTLVLALTGGAFAQSPAPSPAQVDVNVHNDATTPATQPAPVAAAPAQTDVNITNHTDAAHTDATPMTTTSTHTEIWGMDSKTVLIGGALLLGIILIAIAAAGKDTSSTTVVR